MLLGGSSSFRAFVKGFDCKNSIKVDATQQQEFWLVNPENFDSSLIRLGNTYGTGTNYIFEAFELNVKVVDEKGNPIQGAKLYVKDTANHTALLKDCFALEGWAVYGLWKSDSTSGYFRKYNSTYTSYSQQKPSFLSVGDIIRCRWEYITITGLDDNGHFTCQRNQTYNGYTSLSVGRHVLSPLYLEVDYIESDADGEFKFSGEYGDFLPLIVTNAWSNDPNYDRYDRSCNPFTIKVTKDGYEPVVIPNLTINEPTFLTVKLKKAKINPDQEVIE
ncbi:MAG: hypothetical protein DRG78_20735 [Epsilonproteobacteria bacterium]|nr:MAG: hypothetical protein DRG78_20735 [Campylobacterota bacterium]